MSKISLSPDASGTGIFTIASPNSNTNRTLTLPDDTGTIVTNSGNQAGSFTTLNTSGAVVFNDAGADVDFRVEGDTEANLLFVDAGNDRVGIGTSSPATLLNVSSATTNAARLRVTGTGSTGGNYRGYEFGNSGGFSGGIFQDESTSALSFWAGSGGASATIDSSGNVGIGTSSPSSVARASFGNDSGTSPALYGAFFGTNSATSAAAPNFGLTIGWNKSGGGGESNIIYGISAGSAPALAFSTSDGSTVTERMRITSVGFLKASNTGSYTGSTNGHEFISSLGDQTCVIRSTNASFDGQTVQLGANRSATSAYSLLYAFSNLGASPDLEFNLRGDGNAYADGSWNGSGADYAEYFESATGEAIPRGTTVVLENNKVRVATADDPASLIIGVVRPKEFGKGSMVVGNLAWNMWTDKYLTDDFGVYEMEDHDVVEWEETITDEEGNTSTKQHSYESHAIPEGVTVPADATRKTHDENGNKFQHRKLNPNYDPAVEYTPREERPEWLIIGLLGQVPVLKGQPVGDRWVKMRDISETVEEWMIR